MASKKVINKPEQDRSQSAKNDRRIDVDRRNLVRFETLGSDRGIERYLNNEALSNKQFSK